MDGREEALGDDAHSTLWVRITGTFSKQFYKALTWSHTSPSCVAILSYEQGSCEPEGPSGWKVSIGNNTEETCSSDVCSLKAAPPRGLFLFLNHASDPAHGP